ncbi:MAG TPA: hypothetical protein VGT61_00440 [Thermomicrobiales bacterium]|nr:hypothetical protein [Thermomicrobiales bacterium]
MVHERSRPGPAGPAPAPPSPSPRLPSPPPVRRADEDGFDLSYALAHARDWLLGPSPLAANLALALFTGLGVVLWRLSRSPESLGVPWWLVAWAIIVLVHTVVVVLWSALRGRGTSRRPGPVYYAQIPPEQRTRRRPVEPTSRPASAAPAATGPASWQGALAPVTPFPAPRRTEATAPPRRSVSPPAPGDGSAETPAGGSPTPLAPAVSPGLQSAREVLASDQPFWRRLRRGAAPAAPGGALPELSPLPVPPTTEPPSWLAPYPGAPPVTRAAATTPGETHESGADRPEASDMPAQAPAAPTTTVGMGDDQLPSLAEMLRSSNLTAMSDAPIMAGNGSTRTHGAGRTERQPDATPAAPAGATGSTSALFAAFGINEDGVSAAGSTSEAPPAAPSEQTRTLPVSVDQLAPTLTPAPAPAPAPAPVWGPVTAGDAPAPTPAQPTAPAKAPSSTTISRTPTPIRPPR